LKNAVTGPNGEAFQANLMSWADKFTHPLATPAPVSLVENSPEARVIFNGADLTGHLEAGGTKGLSYSLAGADAASFRIDPATGEVRFIKSPDFEKPGDRGSNNIYDVTVTAKDIANNIYSRDLAVSVTNSTADDPVFNIRSLKQGSTQLGALLSLDFNGSGVLNGFRDLLNADANFSSKGVSPHDVRIIESPATVNATSLSAAHVAYSGPVPAGPLVYQTNYTETELTALKKWVQAGNVLVSTARSDLNAIGLSYGLPAIEHAANEATTLKAATQAAINASAASDAAKAQALSILSGAFGDVSGMELTYNRWTDHFNASKLLSTDIVLVADQLNRPIVVMRGDGAGYAVLSSDEAPFSGQLGSFTGSVDTPNEKFAANLMAWADKFTDKLDAAARIDLAAPINGDETVFVATAAGGTFDGAGVIHTVEFGLAGKTGLTVDLSHADAQTTGFGTVVLHGITGLLGGSGNDVFTDGSGNDLFAARGGNDMINLAHGGQNTLLYQLISDDRTGGNGTDEVNGFSVGSAGAAGGGDQIDLRQLLIGYKGDSDGAAHYNGNGVAVMDAGETIGKYLSVTNSDGNTTISIDRDGSGSQFAATPLITLNNTTTDLETLLAHHQLVV
jgi:hypothetical protein